ncbi:hypothetical protein ACFQL0_03825 [Haloplanus litoreus]|uniref:hypothetical protein n=1 Tax=Haloplanus litoreus TaxID=767515 RepID=UPI00361DCBA2
MLPLTAGGVGVVVAAVGGGGVVRALVAGLPPTVRSVATSLLDALSPTGLALGVTLVALTALTTLLTVLVVAGGVGLLPTRGVAGRWRGRAWVRPRCCSASTVRRRSSSSRSSVSPSSRGT